MVKNMKTIEVTNENKKRIEKIFNELFNEVNYIGNEENVIDALKTVLQNQHRTLQQSFFRYVIVPSIKSFADKKRNNMFDLRNEASCELAEKLEPIVKDSHLPFI